VQLDELGFVWDVFDERWQIGLAHLETFKKEFGHCLVPQQYKTTDGYPLGSWVIGQRASQNDIATDRKGQLDALGFVWRVDPTVQSSEGFVDLKEQRSKA